MARVSTPGAMVDFHSPDYEEEDEFDDTCIFRDEVFILFIRVVERTEITPSVISAPGWAV